ncbi:zinc-dependent alcohol dehydrogenase [Seohaeicola zhoushanensis]|uniref:Galactitol-1-phosphate 5-dehydrogenase n=1 Tax=Seohaeicola zhoushanensis TaxID=1569283 RepID=A0A8J3GWD2_9RHOB|nr:alcohol dehydrogenase catalytic domain-containing protein [Seohaeicola zhoushanensis]GHF47007.1 galactitol-1-phosphate 5-dehydrogenase [Seohaeicola zhoushanensis]
MKALVYTGPETLDYRDVADPSPRAGEELIRVERVGICGSDMHAYLGHDNRRPAPLILGHEAAGVIVGGTRDGEKVTINPLVTCGQCPACRAGRDNLCPTRQIISMPPREGAFAGLVAMPPANLVTLPEGVTAARAALAEPVACGWHAVRLGLGALGDRIGSGPGGDLRALVLGGGAIGLGAALSLGAQGVADVSLVEPNPLRRAYLVETCGVRALERAEGPFDLVIDGVGYEATRAAASALVRPGGVIMHIGLGADTGGLDVRRMTLQEITFIGTYTYTAQDFRDTAAAIFDGRLGALDWTEERPLAEGARAFRDIRAGATAAPKILLVPDAG